MKSVLLGLSLSVVIYLWWFIIADIYIESKESTICKPCKESSYRIVVEYTPPEELPTFQESVLPVHKALEAAHWAKESVFVRTTCKLPIYAVSVL